MGAHEPPERVVQRVLSKVVMGPSGCHVSTYSVGSHGYAQVGWYDGGQRTVTLCHRVVWTWFNGPIDKGMTVDHMCKNRRCVRLLHLRLLPNLENARRTDGRDWPLGQCINGHLDSEHWVQGNGRSKGHCRQCRLDGDARRQADPEWQQRRRDYQRRWNAANADKRREAHGRYNAKRRAA